jgi:hypothetical protein
MTTEQGEKLEAREVEYDQNYGVVLFEIVTGPEYGDKVKTFYTGLLRDNKITGSFVASNGTIGQWSATRQEP